MADDTRRVAHHQDADLSQTNDQKTDQANSQDASHHSDVRQDLAVQGHQSQVDQKRVTVTVQNQFSLPCSGPGLGRLSGRMLDVEGTGVTGGMVEVFFGPPIGVPVVVEETDGLGRFAVTDLPPGFYSLRIAAPDGTVTHRWNLRVDAGSDCREQIYLLYLPDRMKPKQPLPSGDD